MHKGPLYELEPRFRSWCQEYPYPNWAPASWTISVATWTGTAAASPPSTPLYLVASGVTAGNECLYECPLFDTGGGVFATLQLSCYLDTPTSVLRRIGGDWGPHGQLPNAARYRFPNPWSPFSAFITNGTTAPELYLAPSRLVFDPTPY